MTRLQERTVSVVSAASQENVSSSNASYGGRQDLSCGLINVI